MRGDATASSPTLGQRETTARTPVTSLSGIDTIAENDAAVDEIYQQLIAKAYKTLRHRKFACTVRREDPFSLR